MDRKFKIMGIYAGLLCFISILLILITSFSNSKFDPSYKVNNNEKKIQVSFNNNLEQSVVQLTEINRKLTDEVNELNKKIQENEKIINNYKNSENNIMHLTKSVKFYLQENLDDAKTEFKKVNAESLNSEYKDIYNFLLNKLN